LVDKPIDKIVEKRVDKIVESTVYKTVEKTPPTINKEEEKSPLHVNKIETTPTIVRVIEPKLPLPVKASTITTQPIKENEISPPVIKSTTD
jgi:hypothetical protein